MTSSQRGAFFAVVFLLVASPVVMVWSWEADRAHQCAELGGTFDYGAMACDPARGEHAFRPFAERHPRLLVGTLAAGSVGAAAGLVAMRRRA